MEDRIIRARIPFLRNKTVMFVPGAASLFSEMPDWVFEEYRLCLKRAGYNLLNLSEVFYGISREMIEYMFPGLDEQSLFHEVFSQIQKKAELEGDGGFLYKLGRNTYFHPVPYGFSGNIEESISTLVEVLKEPVVEPGTIRLQKPRAKTVCLEDAALPRIMPQMMKLEEDDTSPRIRAILEDWDEFARLHGTSIEELYIVVKGRVRLSRLSISLRNEIRLIDWPESPEVKMDDLSKTLYFFFLKHPEGAVLKQLDQFRNELLEIYTGITGREDMEAVYETIERVTDPFYSGRDSLMSRIRKAFRDIVGDPVAKNYYVNGKAGGTYTISLDRDFVLWEH